jgi:hypothetical protein
MTMAIVMNSDVIWLLLISSMVDAMAMADPVVMNSIPAAPSGALLP